MKHNLPEGTFSFASGYNMLSKTAGVPIKPVINGSKFIQDVLDRLSETESTPEQMLSAISKAPLHLLQKTAGGPGSGDSTDNTKLIKMPLSPYITIMKRKAFMDSKEPFLKNRNIEMDNIKYVGQTKYVPKKLSRILEAQKDKTNKDKPLDKPIDVTLNPNGTYAVLDGHHRYLVAKALNASTIKANVYTVTEEDKNGLEKVAANPSALIPRVLQALKAGGRHFQKGNRVNTAKNLGKGTVDLAFGGKTQGNKWDPLFGVKTIGRTKEKVLKGPNKGMYKYDQYGDHVYDMNKKRDWIGFLKDEFHGASRTRADLAAKQMASAKDMNVGQFMDKASRSQKKSLKEINELKVMDFIKKHPKLAANYYGRNVLQKGMVVGFPGMTAYDLASGNAYKNNPNSSKLGTTLGYITEGIGFGLTGPLGIVGSTASSLGGGALANKAGNLISPKPQITNLGW